MDKSIHSHRYSTQVELAASIRESQTFVSKCERGGRRLDVIELRRPRGFICGFHKASRSGARHRRGRQATKPMACLERRGAIRDFYVFGKCDGAIRECYRPIGAMSAFAKRKQPDIYV
jgi:hypothetical protein